MRKTTTGGIQMKNVIITLALTIISSNTFAANVCTHDQFVKDYPNAAANLGNCPADTQQGGLVSCGGHKFFCSSTGWAVSWGKTQNEYGDGLISNKVLDIGEELVSEPKDEIIEAKEEL